jgi:hypothetical protein
MKRLLTIAATSLLVFGAASTVHAQHPDPQQVIANWYQHFFGRPVDAVGLSSWTPALSTRGPQWVAAQLLASQEYWDHNGGTPQGMVLALYRDVLGRSSLQLRPLDVDYWVNKMTLYNSREAMVEEFLSDANVNLYALGAGEAAPPAPAYTPPAYVPPAYVPPATPPTYGVPFWRPYSYERRGHAWGWWRNFGHEGHEHHERHDHHR